MLDFGWPELFVIVALSVLFVGPDELPRVMVALGRLVRRLQYARYAISQQFEEIMRDADLDDIRRAVNFEEGDTPEIYEDAESDEAYATMGLAQEEILEKCHSEHSEESQSVVSARSFVDTQDDKKQITQVREGKDHA